MRLAQRAERYAAAVVTPPARHPSDADRWIQAELAGYRIDSLIGRGGMGVVYRARDLALDRNVALKLLAPELADDVRFRERFLRESRLAASLDHPAIIPIYEAGEVAGQLYIAMRLVEGTDLKQLLAKEGVLEPERALALIQQVADALDTAHERDLVHRDVKPSNILVDERGHCYLADFGLSRRLAEHAAKLASGRSLGTVGYIAPEQIRGEELDGRADLYSLGCVLYECLVGRPPFAGLSDTAVVFAHLDQEPPALSWLGGVMERALAKDPDDRYQSGRELVASAREAIAGESGAGRARRRRLLPASVLLLAAAATAIGGILASRSPTSSRRPLDRVQSIALTPNALNLIDARTRHVVDTVSLTRPARASDAGSDVVFSGRSAWTLLIDRQRVIRVDVATHKATGVVKLPWIPGGRMASGGGFIWVTEDAQVGSDVIGIDARTGKIARRFALEKRAGRFAGIAFGNGSLWLALGAEVARVDPRSGQVVRRFGAESSWVVFADGAVWVASASNGRITKIDPMENRITARVSLHGWVSDLAVGGGFVWVSIIEDGAVYKLGEADLSVERSLPSGVDPERISTGGGNVWVANTATKSVSLLDEVSGARQRLTALSEPTMVQFHAGLVWSSAAHPRRPLVPIAGEELRISTPSTFMTADPARRGTPMDEQLSYATCANLLNYPDAAGRAGTRLRPEIAATMPTVSTDGRTYTLQIRRGFRFSPPSNERVTAETFRHTIERVLSPRAHNPWPYASDIVGASAYSAGKARHISGIAVRGNTLAITLLEPSGDFLTRISMATFCPVPLSVPSDPSRATGPIPSPGPYYVASIEGHRTVLLRNPNYRGGRPRRAARIVYTDDIPTPKAVALADNGQLDYLPLDFDPNSLLAQGGVLDQRYGPASRAARAGRQRYFRQSQPLLDYIVFNTRRPLFRDVRLRRAVSYALDRPALAAAYFDAPSDQIVPPAVPGFDGKHSYPINGPDLRTARLLAGTTRRRAILLAPCNPGLSPVAAIVRDDLAKIGVTVSIVTSDACARPDVAAAFRQADLLLAGPLGRGPTDLDPAPFLDDALALGAWGAPLGPGPWNTPAFRKRLAHARTLRGKARITAYTDLEDRLLRAAPLAVYGSYLYPEYFSPRVGCEVFQGEYHMVDLGALCVRKKR